MTLIGFSSIKCGGSGTETKKRQSFSKGRTIYEQRCMNCHKEDGSGFRELYPELNNGAFLNVDPGEVACIIKYGSNDPIEGRADIYASPMPSNKDLTRHEVAQLMTYMYNAWDNQKGLVTIEEAEQYLNNCKNQSDQNN